jgi:hypothetical protein
VKRLLLPLAIASALVLPGCGSEQDCGVTGMGTKLCGGDAAAWCSLVNGSESHDPDTRSFCSELDAKYAP